MTTRFLDVGCGTGDVAISMGWNREYDEYVGLDIDRDAVADAQAKGLDARRYDVTEGLPFPANHFDRIVAKAVLEHLPDPTAVLRECYRVLKPGGTLRVVVPSDRSYDVWGDHTHKRAYRRDALGRQLEAGGFSDYEISPRMGWSSVGQTLRSVYRIAAPWTPYGYPRAWDAEATKPSTNRGPATEEVVAQ